VSAGAIDVRQARILIIDDEEANVDLLVGLLNHEGYSAIWSTRDAREALPLFRDVRPDLVLLDLHMPYIDGFVVLRSIVEETPPGGYVPVLVLTADVTPEAKQRALSRGARDFLVKPLDATETLLRIHNLLETRLLYQQQAAARRHAEEAEQRARFLAEASRVLTASFDYQTTLGTLARLCVATLADFCIVDVLEGDGGLTRVGCAHANPEQEDQLQQLGRFSSAVNPEHPVLREMREGRSVLIPELAPPLLDQIMVDGEHRVLMTTLAPRSVMCVPLVASGRTLGVMVLCSTSVGRRYDTDDLELAEELARRASLAIENARLFHEARQATRARDEMLAIVAHDLRNPLNTISMGSQLLEEVVDSTRTLEHRQIQVIQRSVRRMTELIQDLLDIKRIESGRLPVEPRQEDLGALVREALEILRPQANARELQLSAELPALPPVLADPARVQQLISNLVGNAIKFTQHGGVITVRAELEPDANEILVVVTDSGAGIPAEHLPHVFGHYWQANRGDRRGIGLGLAIAKGIVEAHGGRIWVRSKEGEGSSFFFTLPAAAALEPIAR
jgi:signal transduction histidine kinase/DNA-binding NarL/FixJ family response regulator